MPQNMTPSRQTVINAAHTPHGAVRSELVHTEKDTYMWSIPPLAPGANKLLFDLFNGADSGKKIRITGLYVIPELDVAGAVTLSVKFDLYLTGAEGTGGDGWAFENASPSIAGGCVNRLHSSIADISASPLDVILGMTEPTGGAAIAHWIRAGHAHTEEAVAANAAMIQQINFAKFGEFGQLLTLEEDEGLLIKQGAVASAGKLGFMLVFTLE